MASAVIDSVNMYVKERYVKKCETTMACLNCGKNIRRGGRKKKHMARSCASSLKIFSTNAASLINGKIKSLKSEILCTKAKIVTVQETHSRRKGKIQIPNFVVYEAIRSKKGEGTIIVAHEDLKFQLIE